MLSYHVVSYGYGVNMSGGLVKGECDHIHCNASKYTCQMQLIDVQSTSASSSSASPSRKQVKLTRKGKFLKHD